MFNPVFTFDTIIAAVTLLVSGLFWFFVNRRSSKIQEELNTLQLQLNKLQLEREQSELEREQKADFRAEVVKRGKSHQLRIINIGRSAAHNISMSILRGREMLVENDPNEPPWSCLEPDDCKSLTLGLSHSSSDKIEIEITWSDAYDLNRIKTLTVSPF